MPRRSPGHVQNLLTSQKRNLLGRKIALSCTGFAILHCLIDFSQGHRMSGMFDLLIIAVLLFAYLLNRWRYYFHAKVVGLGFMNFAFVFYASAVPKEVGVFLYYFPLIAVSSALFGPSEKISRLAFMALPFALLSVLFIVDFKLFGDFEFYPEADSRLFLIVNSVSAGVILLMCLDFIHKLNESSENQLQRLAEEVRAKNEDLEKTNSELDRFLYSTSHDLRSPLSSIKGLINVARYDTTDKKVHGYFNMMIDRVDRLEHFIKDIIDYSKNARTELRPEPINFNQLIAEVVENLKYLEGARMIEFKNEVTVPENLHADKTRLSVVLNNLVANAIKYHNLHQTKPWIDIRINNCNGSVNVQVSDNGTGIQQEHQQKIFDMFYRGTLQSKGSGLGLYIVKQAVEKMQGTISVQSSPGQGSSFLVTIPVS